MNNGVTKSIDSATRHLDRVLSSGRLKPSVRRELEAMRSELVETRTQVATLHKRNVAIWVIQLASLISRVSELLHSHCQK